MQNGPPLVVYLDTQDYVNIQHRRDNTANASVLNYLLTKVADGDIIIPYSPMIVLEFLTRPGSGLGEDRAERGRILKEFCGLNTFAMEFGKPNDSLRSDGNWIGEDLTKGISLKPLLQKYINEARAAIISQSSLNRKARRQLSNDRFVWKYLRTVNPTFGRKKEDFDPIPVSQEFLDGRFMERYLRGEISESTVHEAFSKWMTDPEEFCRIYYEYNNSPNAIDHFFGKTIKSLGDASKKAEDLCKEIIESQKLRLSLRQDIIASGVEKRAAVKMTPPFKSNYNLESLREKTDMTFGVGKGDHFLTYFLAILKGKTSWLSSDFGDLFHFIYAYKCDLFRCDKKMASIMAECPAFSGKLVASFFDLPKRIDEELEGKA
ncbi:MAG: hypothetical protein ABI832_03280 [bacterium]